MFSHGTNYASRASVWGCIYKYAIKARIEPGFFQKVKLRTKIVLISTNTYEQHFQIPSLQLTIPGENTFSNPEVGLIVVPGQKYPCFFRCGKLPLSQILLLSTRKETKLGLDARKLWSQNVVLENSFCFFSATTFFDRLESFGKVCFGKISSRRQFTSLPVVVHV